MALAGPIHSWKICSVVFPQPVLLWTAGNFPGICEFPQQRLSGEQSAAAVGLSPRVTEWGKVMMGNRYIAHGQEGRKGELEEEEGEGNLVKRSGLWLWVSDAVN